MAQAHIGTIFSLRLRCPTLASTRGKSPREQGGLTGNPRHKTSPSHGGGFCRRHGRAAAFAHGIQAGRLRRVREAAEWAHRALRMDAAAMAGLCAARWRTVCAIGCSMVCATNGSARNAAGNVFGHRIARNDRAVKVSAISRFYGGFEELPPARCASPSP